MNAVMGARMYTLLLVDGCHYINAADAKLIAGAVHDGCESVEVVAHVSAMKNEQHTTRISLKNVLKLIAHDIENIESSLQPVSISAFRARRSGRRGSRIPFSTR